MNINMTRVPVFNQKIRESGRWQVVVRERRRPLGIDTRKTFLMADGAKTVHNRCGSRQKYWCIAINMGARVGQAYDGRARTLLSLNVRHRRTEHWVMDSGTAKVVDGDGLIVLSGNVSTSIPVGEARRLANPGKAPLEIHREANLESRLLGSRMIVGVLNEVLTYNSKGLTCE